MDGTMASADVGIKMLDGLVGVGGNEGAMEGDGVVDGLVDATVNVSSVDDAEEEDG